MQSKSTTLRKGYTTGACSAAAAVAAYKSLKSREKVSRIELLFLNRERHKLDVKIKNISRYESEGNVIKDAGDDPDVTNKASISARVLIIEKDSNQNYINKKDHIEKCGLGKVIIKGSSGVGLVTKPGLEVEFGRWAINPGPRKMLIENLRLNGFGDSEETLLVEISVKDGKDLAERTLNPLLGIVGGISILGTTGIVEPYSNAAYIKTINTMINSNVKMGINELAFTTGNRTQKALLRDCPHIKDYSCIRIGDFIYDSIKSAVKEGIETINIACMPGKLYKYSCGIKYTHAHKMKLDLNIVIEKLRQRKIKEASIEAVKKNKTVRQLKHYLPDAEYTRVIKIMFDEAFLQLKQWAANSKLNLFLYDTNGIQIFQKKEK